MMRVKNPRRTPLVLFPLALAAAISGGALAYGCADPKGDLDDFLERNDAAENGDSGAGGAGGSAGAGAGGAPATKIADISGTFVFGCANYIFDDISTAIRFRATNTMSLTGAGGMGPTGGEISMKLQPLATTATSADQVLGTEVAIDAPAPVSEKGEFVFRIGEAGVDGTANPSGTTLVLTNLAWRAVIIDEDNFCARFSGTISQPVGFEPISYADIKNSCVGARAAGGVLPVLNKGQLDNCKALLKDTTAP
jgi:hypothetical protein